LNRDHPSMHNLAATDHYTKLIIMV